MMKPISAVVLTLALSSGVVFAAPPASKDACLEQAFALAEKAAAKKLATDKQSKIEGQLTALEAKCAADDLAGAEGDIKTIEAEIAGG
jgi:hypothetical protein